MASACMVGLTLPSGLVIRMTGLWVPRWLDSRSTPTPGLSPGPLVQNKVNEHQYSG